MFPIHRVRFTWGADRQIEIESVKGRGAPALILVDDPAFSLIETEAFPDEFTLRGIPAICWRDDVPPLFERFQLREHTEYFIDITLPINKAEAEALARERRAWPFADRLASVFFPDPSRRWRETSTANVIVSGQLRLKSHAGILDLRTDFDTPLVAEVVCRKLNYLDEFRTLLNEVAEQLTELLFQYDSPVSFSFDLSNARSENDAALLFQMRHIMNPANLAVAVDEILTSFHTSLIERTTPEAMNDIQEFETDVLIDELDMSVLQRGGPLARLFRGYTPREVTVLERLETADTLENRYVKNFLEECLLIAQRLFSRLASLQKPAAVREAQEWVIQLEETLGHRFWSNIGALDQIPLNSQVLQKRRGYRDILKFDLSLRLGLELKWKRGEDFSDGLLGDVRPVNEIYEYWCFFVLRKLLTEMCETELPGNGSFIAVASDGLQVRLEKGKRSRVSFVYRTVGSKRLDVSLFYNRRFKRPTRGLASWDGSYTAFFDPDYSLLVPVVEGEKSERHWLHFDAKYRLEMEEVEALFASAANVASTTDDAEDGTPYDREIARLHKRDDLFKMHTYRDGILGTRGAYVLFPGDGVELRVSGQNQNMFVRHPTAFAGSPAHQFPGVGAFDLCPGRDAAQTGTIKTFLQSVFDTILLNAPYQEETGPF